MLWRWEVQSKCVKPKAHSRYVTRMQNHFFNFRVQNWLESCSEWVATFAFCVLFLFWVVLQMWTLCVLWALWMFSPNGMLSLHHSSESIDLIHNWTDDTNIYFCQHRLNKPRCRCHLIGHTTQPIDEQLSPGRGGGRGGAWQVNLTSGIFWEAASKAIPTK